MILVADAAPFIFLAKINQLPLLTELFAAEILVPAVVRKEVLDPKVPPDEERLLTNFLSSCKLVAMHKPTRYAKALSFADNCILTLAVKKRADMILSDDRLLRRTAALEGFRVIGTIGVLIHAAKTRLATQDKSAELLDELVEQHNFRISTRVYEMTRHAIYTID
jgi:predicted nucleic acid-binding protein